MLLHMDIHILCFVLQNKTCETKCKLQVACVNVIFTNAWQLCMTWQQLKPTETALNTVAQLYVQTPQLQV